MSGILSCLLSSISSISKPTSTFAPNLSTRRKIQTRMCLKQQLHNKLLVKVTHVSYFPPKISLFSVPLEEEGNVKKKISDISCGHDFGLGVPVASCHELLIMAMGCDNLALWNPSTKEVIKTLPQSSLSRPSRELPLVVYPTKCSLGFDPKTSSGQPDYKDYKVIKFLRFENESGSRCSDNLVELYSLKTDSWKQIAYPHTNRDPILMNGKSIFINGFSYWPAATGIGGKDFVIVSFDFAKDTFPCTLIPGPSTAYIRNTSIFRYLLVEFEGSLGVIESLTPRKLYARGENKCVEFVLWVWNSSKESWSRRGEWAISIPCDSGVAGSFFHLGLFNNHQFFFQNTNNELLLFDCAKQELKNLGLYASVEGVLKVFPYVDNSVKEIK